MLNTSRLMKVRNGLFFLVLLFAHTTFSQIVVDDQTYTTTQLVKDILVNSPCAQVENISSSTGTAFGNNGIAYFERGTSSFPLEAGVILSTGNAIRSAGPNDDFLSDGVPNWPGDSDLENAIGLNPGLSVNHTYIEFDFTPSANFINFNFLLASEEYYEDNPCRFSDAFAFLLKKAGTTDNYENIALIPGTTTPIAVVNVHPAIQGACAARNEEYFDRYNSTENGNNSPINYNGQTKIFTASSMVEPNTKYHIKLVIADYEDRSLDSAIFLEAGSFDVGGNLGEDRTIASGNPGCIGSPVVLDATVGTGATYQWLKNGAPIAGATDAMYNVDYNTDGNGSYSVMVALAGSCAATLDPVEVEFVVPPVIDAPPLDVVICETDGNGVESFEFSANTNRAFGTQDRSKFSVSYHKTQNDANTNANPITFPYSNTLPNETIYLRIAETTQTCFETAAFTISVVKKPIANKPTDFVKCDDAMDGDDTNGSVSFDVTAKIPEVLGTQSASDFAVKFYLSQAAAQNAVAGTEITTHTNTTNPQTIFTRIESVASAQCFSISSFNLEVKPLPVIKPNIELIQCDDDLDGITFFNLLEANELISDNHENETFIYFTSQAAAQNNGTFIATPESYENPTPSSKVYARVIDNTTGCLRIAEIDLIVSATQIPANFKLTYEVCDDRLTDDEPVNNGVTTFNFSDASAQIINLLPPGANYAVSYYQNVSDALAEVNAIDATNYRNTSAPNLQDIYVRVENEDLNSCVSMGEHIQLRVKPVPITNTITAYELCSDTDKAIFDLSTKTAEVIGAQTEAIFVSYHTSLDNAKNDVAPITAPYENTTNPQTIYVRAQFDTDGDGVKDVDECYSTDMTFQLVVNPNPDLIVGTLRYCNDEVTTVYNLTESRNEITQANTVIELSYFESEADYTANNSISDPENYTIDVLEKTLIVLGTNQQTGCFSRTTLNLQTTIYADINKELDTIEECETDTDGIDVFNITVRENQLLNGIDPATISLSYYELEADAIAQNTNAIGNPTAFENTVATRQTIYIRVDQNASDCFQIVPLELSVNSVPPIDFDEQYVLCFDENEERMMPFPVIDSELDEDIYSFEWFLGDTAEAANLIADENGPMISAGATGMYWIRAINKRSGCDFFKSTLVIPSYVPQSVTAEVTSETFSDNNIIEVSVVGKGTYEYRLDDGNYQSSPIFEDVLFGERTITVQDIHGCGSKSTTVFVIDHPKFFTPNGDGINDVWNVVGVALLENPEIFIFDRYGTLIYQIQPNTSGWNGTKNGVVMPSSDYWFKILYTQDGIQKLYKSHFTLKR